MVDTTPDLRLLNIQLGKMLARATGDVKVPVKRFTVKSGS
jgi:hypothetical protein